MIDYRDKALNALANSETTDTHGYASWPNRVAIELGAIRDALIGIGYALLIEPEPKPEPKAESPALGHDHWVTLIEPGDKVHDHQWITDTMIDRPNFWLCAIPGCGEKRVEDRG